MGADLRFFLAVVRTNLRAAVAHRGAFWLQATLMVFNNFIFFTTWWIFFARFRDIGGWRLPELAALYGTVSGAWGISVVFFGGGRELARAIVEGDLDVYLTQPKPPLFHLLLSRSIASGWGDLFSCVVLLGLSGLVNPATLPVAITGVLAGAVVFVANGVLAHSLAFLLGDTSNLSRQLQEFVISFSVYPQTIYAGLLRVALFTILPAGFIGYLPVENLREFRPWSLAALLGGALLYALLAGWLFRRGLRRYESGSRLGVRL